MKHFVFTSGEFNPYVCDVPVPRHVWDTPEEDAAWAWLQPDERRYDHIDIEEIDMQEVAKVWASAASHRTKRRK